MNRVHLVSYLAILRSIDTTSWIIISELYWPLRLDMDFKYAISDVYE